MIPTAPERDPRIYMAVERTFLAWIRTGLSLMGFGFVVARFGLFLRELGETAFDQSVRVTGFSMWAGTTMLLVGVAINVVAAIQHVKTIRDLNAGIEIVGKPSMTGIVLALLMAAAGLTMAAYLTLFR
jgi:putative membrane protein